MRTEMTTDDNRTDPRPPLSAALGQTQLQVGAIRSTDLDRPTPCAGYDVRTLLAHLVAVLRKLTVVRHGGDFAAVADPAVALGDDGPAASSHARGDLERAWGPDPALAVSYALPYGTMTGRELIDAYSHEFTVHAGDLHRALGRDDDLDPRLAEAALDWYSRNVLADQHSEDGPFAPVVRVGEDAGPYTKLAAFVGRSE